MRKIAACLLCIICFARAIEYSHRIKALGTNFAYLIPDYETDLYRNPQILSEKLVGISYGPYAAYGSKPFKCIFSTPRFALLGRYWYSYYYKHEPPSEWVKSYSIHFEDLWMLKIRNEVWNIYNDGKYSLKEDDDYDLDKMLEYFFKAQSSYNLGRLLNLDIKIGLGIYEKIYRYEQYHVCDYRIGIPSARIGLFYRNTSLANQFTSWFIDIGGPISTAEISTLPYPIDMGIFIERKLKFFANALIGKFGWAKGIPINEKSFFAIGVRENFLYQKESISRFDDYLAMTNTVSLPIAVEYRIKAISIRLGTSFSYNFEYTRELHDDVCRGKEIHNSFDYDRSFGLGWQPNNNFEIDIYNSGDISNIDSWAIYFKYLF